MPFVLRYPAEVSGGSLVHPMILNIDFAPTLLDFATTRSRHPSRATRFGISLMAKATEPGGSPCIIGIGKTVNRSHLTTALHCQT